jgi:hypothetical protein
MGRVHKQARSRTFAARPQSLESAIMNFSDHGAVDHSHEPKSGRVVSISRGSSENFHEQFSD